MLRGEATRWGQQWPFQRIPEFVSLSLLPVTAVDGRHGVISPCPAGGACGQGAGAAYPLGDHSGGLPGNR